jgi:hypothetical protein
MGIFSIWKIRQFRPGLNPRTWVQEANTHPLDHRSRCLYALHSIRNVGTFTRWQCLIQLDPNPSFLYFASYSIHFFVLSPVQFLYIFFLYCTVFSYCFPFSWFSTLICPFCFTHLMPFPLSSRLFRCTVFSSPTTLTWFCLNLEPPDVSLHICTKSPAICSDLSLYKALLT